MDSLQDILKTKKLATPDEMSSIKAYVKQRWQAACTIRINHKTIILSVPSSALAATIQMEKQQLVDACSLDDKRLIIRGGL